jgi:hypothetical protein
LEDSTTLGCTKEIAIRRGYIAHYYGNEEIAKYLLGLQGVHINDVSDVQKEFQELQDYDMFNEFYFMQQFGSEFYDDETAVLIGPIEREARYGNDMLVKRNLTDYILLYYKYANDIPD